jgi:hypothetical protein
MSGAINLLFLLHLDGVDKNKDVILLIVLT